jgi:4-amino-4-deoxy-L-arabinose transferase-like glycosyltransferase
MMTNPEEESWQASAGAQAGLTGALRQLSAPGVVLAVALLSRMIAAGVMQSYVARLRPPRLCFFPDTNYYWLLARAIREGRPYEIVEQGTISFKAMRTPGYPLFLAACQAILGEWPLGVRLVQAVLGTASVWLVYLLTRRCEPSHATGCAGAARCRRATLAAAILAAIDPYYIAISELLLSEALFIPLLLASVLGIAILWRTRDEAETVTPGRRALIAIASGVAGGAAILARPSFALFIPCVLVCWIAASAFSRDRRLLRVAIRSAILVAAGVAVVMGPWWVRNARTYGRFVATSVWFGASLYDGLNPAATGASDMKFREQADIRTLDELEQDATLTRRAVAFARENPGRVLELALIKFGRYFSPWPNAEEIRSPWLAVLSATIVIPVYCLIIAGLWQRRRDARALVLLAGPLVYFCAMHLVFVSSIRYRIPGEMVAATLAGMGFARMRELRSRIA